MSLKTFHVVFVACSVMLMLVLAGWSFGNYRAAGRGLDLAYAVASVAAAGALLVYGRIFLKKLKHISYL